MANPKLFFLQGVKAVVHSEFRVVMTLLRLFPMDELLLNRKLPFGKHTKSYGIDGPCIVDDYPLKIVIFHRYVSLPEGTWFKL